MNIKNKKETTKAIIISQFADSSKPDMDFSYKKLINFTRYCTKENLEIEEVCNLSIVKKSDIKKMIKFLERTTEKIALVTKDIMEFHKIFAELLKIDQLIKQDKVEIHLYNDKKIISANSSTDEKRLWNMLVISSRYWQEKVKIT